MNNEAVLVINPGSTSTKIAVYERKEELFAENVCHAPDDLQSFKHIADQLEYRYEQIKPHVDEFLAKNACKIIGVVGRGGIVKPISGGTYRINERFLADARSGEYGEHASNLGSLLTDRFKYEFNLQNSYTVDPVSTNTISEIAEVSGVPGILRNGRAHTLNIKMTARKIAEKQQISIDESVFVIAHLGGGISIALVESGDITDVNDGLLGMGPFTPNRAGALPLRGVMKLCYSKPYEEVKDLFSRNSGFKAYLGTEDMRAVLKMVGSGDEKASLIYRAFIYQVAKEIGACFAASQGRATAISITGGIALSEKVLTDIKSYVGNLTTFLPFPGENEMEALSEGFYRIYDGQEEALEYE